MTFTCINFKPDKNHFIITINRPDAKNSINLQLITEINKVLDIAEKDENNKLIVIEGLPGVFCTGMDFKEISSHDFAQASQSQPSFSGIYMSMLKRFATIPKVILSKIDGKVIAGGVGIASASDLVYATEKSTFSLSEALWGILPANVMPYLIRRVGFQKAYSMTLTTNTISAKDAFNIHLVDEVGDNLDDLIRRLVIRLTCIDGKTIYHLKKYFRKMWIIDEQMEKTAIDELGILLAEPHVQKNIRTFVEKGKLPWEA